MSPEPAWNLPGTPKPVEPLNPGSDDERSLWEEIDRECEAPIRTTLKRINRILQKSFSDNHVQTCSSCTGHMKHDGSMLYEQRPKELADEKIERRAHIFLQAPTQHVSPDKKMEIEHFLGELFTIAIINTNNSLNISAMALENKTKEDSEEMYAHDSTTAHEVYLYKFYFKILRHDIAFRCIQTFWEALEQELNKRDGLTIHTELTLADFLKDIPLNEGYVLP